MVFMLSNLFANFALVASSLSFERYIKFIPPILSLQKLNITAEVKILSLDALPKLANLVNLLTVSPYSVTRLLSISSCKKDPFSINSKFQINQFQLIPIKSKFRTMLTQIK